MKGFLPTNDHFLYNVSALVGRGGANLIEDVYLVQFLIKMALAAHQGAATRPDLAARMQAVPVTGTCDDATIDGIKAVQEQMKLKHPGTIVDGRVSPAHGTSYGGGTWTIVTLNSSLRKSWDHWPRLWEFQGCPEIMQQRAREIFGE